MAVVIEEEINTDYGNFRAHEHKLSYKAKIKKSQAVSKEIML